jgi:hypothetical protein
MKARSICKRCHRLRAALGQKYCATCQSALRALEKPRQARGATSEPPPEGTGEPEGGGPPIAG